MTGTHTTSIGHDISDAGWLDYHFNFSRETYAEMLRWVGFQPGWRVLDAGCGSGSFLPWLADIVGPRGCVSALDLAPEHIAEVEARIAARPLVCPVETRVGNVTALPYPDRTFDALWNSNMAQYLSGAELAQMLAEFRRVVKPGGTVAIKEYTDQYWNDPDINRALPRWTDAMIRAGDAGVAGRQRATRLPRQMRDAGLLDERDAYFTLGKYGPLNANDAAFIAGALAYYASYADAIDISSDDRALWHRVAAPAAAQAVAASPDFYFRIGYIQVVACAPE